MDIIAIANQKGGAGKTSTAAALWYWLNSHGKPTLAIDLDAQANLTYTAGASMEGLSIFHVLQGQNINKAIQTVTGGDIIPASYELNGADIALSGKPKALKTALSKLSKQYEYVILDTEPHLGALSVNALTAAHRVIIPTQADIFSLQGIKQIWRNIKEIRQRGLNPSLKVDGLLITRYSNRATLSKEMRELLETTARKMETKVYQATIREAVAVKESQVCKTSVFDMTPPSKVIADYEAFISEVLKG